MQLNNISLFILSFILANAIGLTVFITWSVCERLLSAAKIITLKKKIHKNPFIGKPQGNHIYLYQENQYRVSYNILVSEKNKKSKVAWISVAYPSMLSSRTMKKIQRNFTRIFQNRNWLYLLRPSVIFPCLLVISITYFSLIESQQSKEFRLRWITARILGVAPEQVRYGRNGWVEVNGEREIITDGSKEDFTYTVNVWRLLFHGDAGSIRRQRKEPYGEDINRLRIGEGGAGELEKGSLWQKFTVSGNTIEWEIPQGTGVRKGKILGHEVLTKDGELHLLDK